MTATQLAKQRSSVPDCPFVGLSPFTEDNSDFFFGRAEDRKRIIGNLRVARLTLLYAESGVGKSSVLRAGATARLRELALERAAAADLSVEVPVLFSAWSADPIPGLIDAIVAATSAFVPGTLDVPRSSLEAAIVAATQAADADLLIILDQFEEYFSNQSRDGRTDSFPEELADCVNRQDLRVRFLIAVREDAYAGVGDLFKSRIANVYGNYLHIDYLDEAAARDAILKPIDRWNELHEPGERYDVEPALVDEVVKQVRLGAVGHDGNQTLGDTTAARGTQTRVETTYLQLVMKRLWEEESRDGAHTLRVETLHRLGDAEEIIRSHLDTAMAQLTAEQRDAAARVFQFLVTRTGMKIAISASDLADMADVPEPELLATLRLLASPEVHILRSVVAREDRGLPRFEIYHDALAQPIRGWRTRYLQGKEEEKQRAELDRQQVELQQARGQARRERRRRLALSGISVLLVGLLVATFFLWRRSEDLSHRDASAKLAAQSLSGGSNPEQSLSLANQALDEAQTPEALHAAALAMANPYVHAVFPQDVGDPKFAQIVESPDGRFVAFGSTKGTWLWDRKDKTTREFKISKYAPGGKNRSFTQPFAIRFNAQSNTVLVVGPFYARTYHYDAKNGNLHLIPQGEGISAPRANSLFTTYFVGGAISPDGARLMLLQSGSTNVQVVDPNGRALGPSMHVASPVVAADWSDHGQALVTLGADATMSVWTDAGGSLAQRSVPVQGISSYRLSPDGTSLATGTTGGVDLWHLPDLVPLPQFKTSPGDSVDEIAFQGNLLVAAGHRGDVRVFDLTNPGAPPRVVRTGGQFADGQNGRWGGPVTDLALPKLPILLTSNSGSISVWDVQTGAEIAKYDLSGQLFDLHVAPATGTYDFLQLSYMNRSGSDDTRVGRLRLWNGKTARSLQLHDASAPASSPVQVLDPSGSADQTSFARDQKHLIVVSGTDAVPPAWKVQVRSYPGLAAGPSMHPSLNRNEADSNSSISVAFDEHASTLVSVTFPSDITTSSNRIEVWDPSTGSKLRELTSNRPHGFINAIDVSPRGEYLWIVGDDFTRGPYIERIPVAGGPATTVDTPHDNRSLVISDDGNYYVTGTEDGGTVVHSTGSVDRNGRQLHAPSAMAEVDAVAISEGSKLVAAGSADGTVVLWDRRSGRVERRFEFGSGVEELSFSGDTRYLVVKGLGVPTQIYATNGDTGANAVVLRDPTVEPMFQAAAFDPRRQGQAVPSIVSTDGRYVLAYPCGACSSKSQLLDQMDKHLRTVKIEG
jgi:WD40 repeat protein